MAYEPRFQPCPYCTSNNKCVNKKIIGKHCSYKRIETCGMYLEWAKGQLIDSGCVETPNINTSVGGSA